MPVSMAEAGSDSEPPAISDTGLFTPETRLVTARLSTSRTLTAPPESSRLPWKLLVGWASVMSPLPAFTVAVPAATIEPPVCRIGALVVVRPRVPSAVTSLASVIAPLEVSATVVPRSVPIGGQRAAAGQRQRRGAGVDRRHRQGQRAAGDDADRLVRRTGEPAQGERVGIDDADRAAGHAQGGEVVAGVGAA